MIINNTRLLGLQRRAMSYYDDSQLISSTNLPDGLSWNASKSRYELTITDSQVTSSTLPIVVDGLDCFPDSDEKVCVIFSQSVYDVTYVESSLSSTCRIYIWPYMYRMKPDAGAEEACYTQNRMSISCDMFVIQNPNLNWTAGLPQYSHGGIYLGVTGVSYTFDFPDGVSYSLSSMLDKIEAGSDSKSTITYRFYLDHTALKNDLAAKASTYTTINLYHLDGTPW